MWNLSREVTGLFREYMGTGLIIIWYLVSVIYLFLKEKRRHYRILFIYMPVIILLLFFNPVFAGIIYKVTGEEIYYRILWLLPVTIGIAFAVVRAWGELQGRKKTVFAVSAAVLLAVSGSYIYSNPFFSRAQNQYHVPQEVVEICDAIHIDGREVMAMFPLEMVQFVRQYDPTICMPFGREALVARWGILHPLEEQIRKEVIDAKQLAELAMEEMVVYLILPKDKEIIGDLSDYDYVYFDTIGGCVLYWDPGYL